MKTIKYISILTLSFFFLLISCCKSDDNDDNNPCPDSNTSTPLILGDWVFTGTTINGELLIDECDLLTTLEVTNSQFKWTSFFGNNCSESNLDISCYKIEDGKVMYYNEDTEEYDFIQEITTLNATILILETVNNNSNDVVTENYARP